MPDLNNKIIYIPLPNGLCFESCLEFLDRGYDECLYTLTDKSVVRCIRLSNALGLIRVQCDGDNIIIELNKQSITEHDIKVARDYVTDWFDSDRDIGPFYELLNKYPQTSGFVAQFHGLRLMGIVDLFEALCWCVIGQQINLTFAHKIKRRLVHHCDDALVVNGQKHYVFPDPHSVLKISDETLKKMKFSRQKINYLRNISRAFIEHGLSKKGLLNCDHTEQMKQLLSIKGIGPWTANYVSMKSLRNMRCIAYGDTGLSAALHKHFDTEKKPNNLVIDRLFKPFAPWESYFNFYLWRSLS